MPIEDLQKHMTRIHLRYYQDHKKNGETRFNKQIKKTLIILSIRRHNKD
jgi:hypothetical protein